jgi:hypothetical protein
MRSQQIPVPLFCTKKKPAHDGGGFEIQPWQGGGDNLTLSLAIAVE